MFLALLEGIENRGYGESIKRYHDGEKIDTDKHQESTVIHVQRSASSGKQAASCQASSAAVQHC